MPSSLVDFISTALRGGVECSVADLRTLPEYKNMGGIEVIRAIEQLCAQAQIECHPNLESGEIEDRRVFSPTKSADEFSRLLEDALKNGEGHSVEFKQTLGLNIQRLEKDKEAKPADLFQDAIIHEVLKTITGFMNADGGTLVIGVTDHGDIYGIEREFPYVGGNLDQWELRLGSALQAAFPDYRLIVGYIKRGIIKVGNIPLCVIRVEPRRDRITVCRSKPGSDEELVYRRAGNQTLKLQARDIEALVLDRTRSRPT